MYNRVSFTLFSHEDDIQTNKRLSKMKNDDFDTQYIDKGLIETMFNYGRYLLISSSREGTQPAKVKRQRLFFITAEDLQFIIMSTYGGIQLLYPETVSTPYGPSAVHGFAGIFGSITCSRKMKIFCGIQRTP